MKIVLNLPDVTDHAVTELEFGKSAVMVVFPTRDFADDDERARWEKVVGQAMCTVRDEMGWQK